MQQCTRLHVCAGLHPGATLRQQSLVVPDKADRVYNFHQQTLHALKELVQAAGLNHPSDITAHHIARRTVDRKVLSFAQLILTQLPAGALLQDELVGLPLIYQHSLPLASANSFMLRT